MSSRASAPTLELNLRPSLRAIRILLALHAGAVVLVFLAQPPKWAALALASAFLASWFGLRRHPAFGYGPRALTRLVIHGGEDEGQWTIESLRHGREDARLLGDTYMTQPLIALNLRTAEGRRRSRLIFGDEVAPEPLRRLRAHLLAQRGRTGSKIKIEDERTAT